MKETSLSRLSAGVGIIVIGVAALLGALDIINFNYLFQTYWPLLLIAAGVVMWLENPKQGYLWAIAVIILGITAQLNTLDVTDINFWQLFWPVILIVIGWSILSKRSSQISDATSDISAILSGTETKSNAKDYKGGKISAVLGGVEMDLSRASIKKEATIEVFALMGGIELRVPDNWEVRTSLMPILGGSENKANAPSSSKAPVLNIVGTIVLGGIEIKN